MTSFSNSEDPDEIIRVYTAYKGKTDLQIKEYKICCFFNYKLTPLDIYRGLAQVYWKNPFVYNGFITCIQ